MILRASTLRYKIYLFLARNNMLSCLCRDLISFQRTQTYDTDTSMRECSLEFFVKAIHILVQRATVGSIQHMIK